MESLNKIIPGKTELRFTNELDVPGLNPGFTLAVVDRLKRLAIDDDAPKPEFRSEKGVGGLELLFDGFHALGQVAKPGVRGIESLFDTMVEAGKDLEDYRGLSLALKELKKISDDIRKEFEGIKLTGFLPGSCKYCPR